MQGFPTSNNAKKTGSYLFWNKNNANDFNYLVLLCALALSPPVFRNAFGWPCATPGLKTNYREEIDSNKVLTMQKTKSIPDKKQLFKQDCWFI